MLGKSSIPWERRVRIFLDYRHLGKVYPVAKSHNIARSTVAAIIEQFVESGFSPQPRLSLSPGTLSQMQDHHFRGVLQHLQRGLTIHLIKPFENLRSGLDPKDALGEGADLKVAEREPLSLDEELVWHITGTIAESTIPEVPKAVGA